MADVGGLFLISLVIQMPFAFFGLIPWHRVGQQDLQLPMKMQLYCINVGHAYRDHYKLIFYLGRIDLAILNNNNKIQTESNMQFDDVQQGKKSA